MEQRSRFSACIAVIALLLGSVAVTPALAQSDTAGAESIWIPLRATCHDGVWEAAEFCGRDAWVTTGVAEMNHDCFVDLLDMGLFKQDVYHTGTGLSGDLNGDGEVDLADIQIFAASRGLTASPCSPGGMQDDSCSGTLALSLDPDPSNIVSTGNLPTGYHYLYVVGDELDGAATLGFGIETSSNVDIMLVNLAVPGLGGDTCATTPQQRWAEFTFMPALGSGPQQLATILVHVIDTSPAQLELTANICYGESQIRWAGIEHSSSNDILTIGNVGLNGAIPPAGISTCPADLRPQLVSARVTSPSTLEIAFDRLLDPQTAGVPDHYSVRPGLEEPSAFQNASAFASGATVMLEIEGTFVEGEDYVVVVNEVRSAEGIPILPDSWTYFRVLGVLPQPVVADDHLVVSDWFTGQQYLLYQTYFGAYAPTLDGWTSHDLTAGVGDYAGAFPLEAPDPCRGGVRTNVMFLQPYAGAPINYGPPGFEPPSSLSGIHNEVWSPPIEWDVPYGPGATGGKLVVTVWEDLPIDAGVFYTWGVRSSNDGGATWTDWYDDDLVYYQPVPQYATREFDFSHLILTDPTHIQISLGIWDLAAEFGLSGADVRPSPGFDTVAVYKYDTGIQIRMRERDLLQDGFPRNGSIDVSSVANRDALNIGVDVAHDSRPDMYTEPGDSVEVLVSFPSEDLTPADADVRLVWFLQTNPLFEESIRHYPPTQLIPPGAGTASGWVDGIFAGQSGPGRAWRYNFYLPDQDFLYPGDVLRYYVYVSAQGYSPTTLPQDVSDFLTDWSGGGRFVIHGLPTLTSPAGNQPPILWVNAAGERDGAVSIHQSLRELGLIRGTDYDMYTVQAPGYAQSNGIGSAGGHGATAGQLAGYRTIIVTGESLSEGILSDGSGQFPEDDADDLQLLTAWHDLPGDRSAAFFGNNLAQSNDRTSVGSVFNGALLGLSYDAERIFVSEVAPRISPSAYVLGFSTEFIGFGGCRWRDGFDQITPLAGAQTAHYYLDPRGRPYLDIAASVLYERFDGPDRKIDMTFPYGFSSIWIPILRSSTQLTTRSFLLNEILCLFGYGCPGTGPATSVPTVLVADLRVGPNPFNPFTVIEYDVPKPGPVTIEVYNLAGRRIRQLVQSPSIVPGNYDVTWDGTDQRGVTVASGVYVVKAQITDVAFVKKVALVK